RQGRPAASPRGSSFWRKAIEKLYFTRFVRSCRSVDGLQQEGARAAGVGGSPGAGLRKATGPFEAAFEALRLKAFSGGRDGRVYDDARSELSTVLASCRRILWALAVFSGLSNLLMLNGSFFMLQVYDRVLPGRSIPTLIALLVLVSLLYALQGGLDFVRTRVSVRVGRYLDERLGVRVYDALVRLPLKTRGDGDGLQPLRDLDQIRSFL